MEFVELGKHIYDTLLTAEHSRNYHVISGDNYMVVVTKGRVLGQFDMDLIGHQSEFAILFQEIMSNYKDHDFDFEAQTYRLTYNVPRIFDPYMGYYFPRGVAYRFYLKIIERGTNE